MRPCLFCLTLIASILIIAIAVSGINPAMGRDMTQEELSQTFGTCYDCNGVKERTCSGDTECDGCNDGSVCYSTRIYTGNSYYVTTSGDDNWGFTKQDHKVDCYTFTLCDEDGGSMPDMDCNENGNCTSGSGSCVECKDGADGSTTQYWSYICAC